MKSIFKFFIPLLLGGIPAAQPVSLSGTVRDASTGLPLFGANIVVDRTDRGTVSGPEGYFLIPNLPDSCRVITVSMIGYAAETVPFVEKSGPLSVYLTPIILESNIRVQVYGQSQNDSFFDHIQKTSFSNTENMISLIDGVALIRRGNYAQEPVIRGLAGGQINITINGMKSFGACTDRMDPVSSYVEADALHSVEIGKGSLSLVNGPTVGGTLNLTFLPPEISSRPVSSWGIRGSVHNVVNSRTLTGNWQVKQPGYGLSLNSTYRKAGDYYRPDGAVVPFSGYEKFSFHLSGVRRWHARTRFQVELISDDAWDVGYAALPMDVGYARMRMLGLTVITPGPGPHIPRVEWKVYGNRVDHWMDDSQRRERFMNMHMSMPGRTRTAGSYLDMVIFLNNASSLTLRSDFYWNSSYAEMVMYPENSTPMRMVTWPDMRRWNLGQYIGYQSALSSQTTLKAAVRYDAYFSDLRDETGKNLLRIYYPDNTFSRQDVLLTGNLSLVHRINSYWQTTLAVARGSRIPTVTEAYGYYLYLPVDGYLYLGDPDLSNETSLQFEFRNRFTAKKAELTANVYQYFFRNYIVGAVMDTSLSLGYARGWKRYANGGPATLTGAELSLLSHINPHWTGAAGMNFQIGAWTRRDDYLPMISPLEFHVSLTYRNRKFWVQAEGRGAGKQTRYSVLSGENFTPGYSVYSLKTEYGLGQRLSLGLEIQNLTNVFYYDHLDWGDIYRPGRSVLIAIIFQG